MHVTLKAGVNFASWKFLREPFFRVTYFWGWWKKKNRRDRKERFATRCIQWAISELARASVSKRVIRVWFAWKWTCRGHKFSHEWFHTKTGFEAEPKGNSEIAYWLVKHTEITSCPCVTDCNRNGSAIRRRYHLVHYPSSFILHTGIPLRLHLQSNWLLAE